MEAALSRKWSVGGRMALQLLCFVFPVLTLLFVASGPHPWWIAWLGIAIFVGAIWIDAKAGPERRQPPDDLPAPPFSLVLFLLAALQVANLAALVRLASLSGLASLDTWVAVLLVGSSSGYVAIVVAHELVHRADKRLQTLGRLLMCTVLYEHFATEHVRGHHRRVGTEEDGATARYGETWKSYWSRTKRQQFVSAWRLETKRLGDVHMPLLDHRQLRNRVLHGIVVEWGLAFALLALLGPAVFVAWLAQAWIAVVLLEGVNYIEHWGLARAERRVTVVDSWDAESWFTYYTLVGLSRHADHHANAARPYQSLRHFEESPKMPYGYYAMVMMAWFRNDELRALLTEELERRRLGPFREAAA